MDRTVHGDVQQDTYRERDVDAATRDLTVNHQSAGDPRPETPLPPEAASYQIVLGDIPRQPPGFQPRANLLAKLNRPGQGVSVLTGPQGAGKTQLAAAYARAKLARGWRLVAWINAGNSGSLLAGLAAVADAAGLSDRSDRDSANAGVVVRRWLESNGDRCLLVFDDTEDPYALRPFIPASGAARVLITSTRQSADLGTSVPVDAFSAEEALAVLAGPTGLDDEAGATSVAALLGRLPLALALAKPVIAGQDVEYAWYLDRLQAMPTDVALTKDDEQPDQASVARTVLLSLQAVWAADRTGVCTRVMEVMALLSTAGIRRELLHVAGQAGALASGRRRVAVDLVDQALEWLSDRSLLTFSLDGQTIIMHRQVAQVIRDELVRRHRFTAVCVAAAFVLEAYARALVGSQDRRAIRGIPQHVMALQDNMAEHSTEANQELVRILLRLRFIMLYHLIELGDSTQQAIAVGEPLAADLERLLGPHHPDTLNSRNSVAAAYLAAGRTTEAILPFEQILAVRQRLLGPDHPDTLTSQNNLAAAYQDAGRSAEAIRLYRLNLEVRERLLGPDHPSTLNSRGNLAAAYLAAGRVAEAIPLLEQTFDGRERVLAPDHPDTSTSRKNLAKAYRDADRVAEAILIEQTLDGRERVLAPDHPDTQTSPKNLANSYRDGIRVAEAIQSADQTLAAWKSQPPATAAGQLVPGGFRRPPADPARRVLPAGFRRPPAGPARQPVPDGLERPSAKLTDYSSANRTQDPSHRDVQYDRRVVAAIMAGDPAGIAMAYDRYAAALYGYCHWMLHDPAAAAAALQDTLAVAVATLSDLSEPSTLRPWLFMRARNECRHRIRTTSATRDEQANSADQRSNAGQRPDALSQPTAAADPVIDATVPIRVVSERTGATREPTDATMTFRLVSQPTGTTNGLADVKSDLRQAELRTLIYSILAELRPREREVIELSFMHDLHENDLAIALGVSRSRAQAQASRAHARLEEALSVLHIALTRREACQVLGKLLADWDGRLTEQTRDLVGLHIEQCLACANHGQGALRSAAFSRLLPFARLPPELRKQVLNRCSSTAEDAVAYRRRVARRAESRWFAGFSEAIGWRWDGIRANPGPAIATVAVTAWVVAAATVTLLILTGSHAAHAQVDQPSVKTSSSSPAPAASTAAAPKTTPSARTTTTAAPTPAAPRPSPTVSQPTQVPSPVQPSPSHSPKPSKSPSPSPSHTASPSPSYTPSPSPSHTASPSPSSSSSASTTA